MPVQSEHYGKIKPVCDRVAWLACQCCDAEFDKRFTLLQQLCDVWAKAQVQQLNAADSNGDRTEVGGEILSQLSRDDPTTYCRDVVHVTEEGTSLWDLCNGHQINGRSDRSISKSQQPCANDVVNCKSELSWCQADTLVDHCSPHRPLEQCPYVCCLCEASLESPIDLVAHLNQHDYFSAVGKTASKTNHSRSSVLHSVTFKDKLTSRPRSQPCVRSRRTAVSCKQCATQFTSVCQLRAHLCKRCTSMPADSLPRKPATQYQELSQSRDSRCRKQSRANESHSAKHPRRAGRGGRRARCKECGADDFKTWKSLAVHRRLCHAATLPHPCKQCPRRFLYACELRKHSMRHSGARPHVCQDCGKGFIHASDLEVHLRAHRGTAPLTCAVCNKWMASMTGLRAHMRIHRPNAPLNVCKTCDKRFSYLSSLRAHMKRVHQPTTSGHAATATAPADDLSGRQKPVAHVDNVVNGETTALTVSKTEQNLHSAEFTEPDTCTTHGSTNGGVPGGPVGPQPERWQRKYPGGKIDPYSCEICGRQFLQLVQLRKHMVKHANSSSDDSKMAALHTCYVCQRKFLFATDLRRHLISHSDDRPYVCVVCTRPFKREDDLTKHLKTHSVRPYHQCPHCSEQFETAGKLRRHTRQSHPDQFDCTLCRLTFGKRSLLAKHWRQLHADDGSVGLCYMCDRCGKSFLHDTELRTHIYSVHSRRRPPRDFTTAHPCQWCGRGFASSSHLAAHERTHTKDRPYTCDQCGKQFTQCGSLNVHRRTHTDPQPWHCGACGQKFASKQYLRKHTAMRHSAATVLTTASDDMPTINSTLVTTTAAGGGDITTCPVPGDVISTVPCIAASHTTPTREPYTDSSPV